MEMPTRKSVFLDQINAEITCLESELSRYKRYLGVQMSNFRVLETFFDGYFGRFTGMYFFSNGDMRLKVVRDVMPVGYNVGVEYLVISPFAPYQTACYHPEYAHDEVPEKMGRISTNNGALIGEFKNDADLLPLVRRLYPMEIVKSCYGEIDREMRAKEEQKKQEWNSKVQSKKAEATSVGFTYDGGKSIDSMATLESFSSGLIFMRMIRLTYLARLNLILDSH